ncbi:small nuclear ribonucleoprotein SmD1a [Brassica rapa]|uniref:small nuclear ribonucleoprotein SmD1a n=1 Tax=Brassica campestris TaxID=3711 RepID=UPI00142DA17B|nr:small nuclear ribonucleoprotein SmD1a [Brassica rapa]
MKLVRFLIKLNNDRAQERYPVVSSLALSLTVKLTLKGKNPVTSRSSKLEWGNNIRYYILLDSLNLVSLLVENTPRGKAIGRCRGRGRDKRGR